MAVWLDLHSETTLSLSLFLSVYMANLNQSIGVHKRGKGLTICTKYLTSGSCVPECHERVVVGVPSNRRRGDGRDVGGRRAVVPGGRPQPRDRRRRGGRGHDARHDAGAPWQQAAATPPPQKAHHEEEAAARAGRAPEGRRRAAAGGGVRHQLVSRLGVRAVPPAPRAEPDLRAAAVPDRRRRRPRQNTKRLHRG